MLALSIPLYFKMYKCDDCGKLVTRVYSSEFNDTERAKNHHSDLGS